MERLEIIVNRDGSATFVYDDRLARLLADMPQRTRRASHVEPYDGSGGEAFAAQHADGTWWVADMRPVDGPLLGPFPGRRQALDAEVAWLRERMAAAPLEVQPC
jgi:hypothetical protein